MRKKLILTFPPSIVDKPVVHTLMKEFDLWINIHRAIIEPGKHGKIVIELRGDGDMIEKGIKYAVEMGVDVNLLEHDVVLDRDRCVDCGMCTSICPANALKLDKDSHMLSIDYDECVVCGFCVDVCPVKAISIDF